MPSEIERKFLVSNDRWREAVTGSVAIRQAYLAVTAELELRVRIIEEEAWITIKTAGQGAVRGEYEYAIPVADAEELARRHLGVLVQKVRSNVRVDGATFVVDEFGAPFAGHVVAEIELEDEGRDFPRPSWLGREITEDRRYTTARLALEGLPN